MDNTFVAKIRFYIFVIRVGIVAANIHEHFEMATECIMNKWLILHIAIFGLYT